MTSVELNAGVAAVRASKVLTPPTSTVILRALFERKLQTALTAVARACGVAVGTFVWRLVVVISCVLTGALVTHRPLFGGGGREGIIRRESKLDWARVRGCAHHETPANGVLPPRPVGPVMNPGPPSLLLKYPTAAAVLRYEPVAQAGVLSRCSWAPWRLYSNVVWSVD